MRPARVHLPGCTPQAASPQLPTGSQQDCGIQPERSSRRQQILHRTTMQADRERPGPHKPAGLRPDPRRRRKGGAKLGSPPPHCKAPPSAASQRQFMPLADASDACRSTALASADHGVISEHHGRPNSRDQERHRSVAVEKNIGRVTDRHGSAEVQFIVKVSPPRRHRPA